MHVPLVYKMTAVLAAFGAAGLLHIHVRMQAAHRDVTRISSASNK